MPPGRCCSASPRCPPVIPLAARLRDHDRALAALLRAVAPSRRAELYDAALADTDTTALLPGTAVMEMLPAAVRAREAARVLTPPAVRGGRAGAVLERVPAVAAGVRVGERCAALGRRGGSADGWRLLVAAARRSRDPRTVAQVVVRLGRLRNEQDPVRAAALTALATVAPLLTAMSAGGLTGLTTDAVDARDTSATTTTALSRLAVDVLTLHVDVPELAEWALRTIDAVSSDANDAGAAPARHGAAARPGERWCSTGCAAGSRRAWRAAGTGCCSRSPTRSAGGPGGCRSCRTCCAGRSGRTPAHSGPYRGRPLARRPAYPIAARRRGARRRRVGGGAGRRGRSSAPPAPTCWTGCWTARRAAGSWRTGSGGCPARPRAQRWLPASRNATWRCRPASSPTPGTGCGSGRRRSGRRRRRSGRTRAAAAPRRRVRGAGRRGGARRAGLDRPAGRGVPAAAAVRRRRPGARRAVRRRTGRPPRPAGPPGRAAGRGADRRREGHQPQGGRPAAGPLRARGRDGDAR
ncbi:hypothetical protein V2I01_26815 [Micromonospora sp. BRA006-A]|nr:hypothetical protein [Micromonospora sp. BRA006-A]